MDSMRLRSIGMIAVFDIGGPLVAYYVLRSAGFSAVSALVLSGVFPAAGIIIGIISRRRAGAVGVLVLSGIVVGAVFGLVSHNARLVLDEGSVPTAVFGLICLGSLGTAKPLMYRLAHEFVGPDTPKGRDFADFWHNEVFRRSMRVITIVWGATFVAEAVAFVLIVQSTSAGTALALSNVLPLVVAGILLAWTLGYGQYQKPKAERLAAAVAQAEAQEGHADAVHAEPPPPPDQP